MFYEATSENLGAKRAQHAVMEVSSHALEQGRVWGIPFEVAVFTNLTRDHLDFHGDMQKYSAAKQLLFEGVGSPPPRLAVINTDDEFGRKLTEPARARGSKVTTYGLQSPAELRAESVQLTPQGHAFLCEHKKEFEIESPLLGKVNVHNLLAAAGASHALGYSWQDIAKAAASSKGVPAASKRSVSVPISRSRLCRLRSHRRCLRNLTAAARDFVAARPGDHAFRLRRRSRSQQTPADGHAAGEGSDFVVLTSDNPAVKIRSPSCKMQ